MYRWYERAAECFVYLFDVSATGQFIESDWFRRGWTLQELLAPSKVELPDHSWRYMGTSTELRRDIVLATKIDEELLSGVRTIHDYSVTQRMSWAATRRTTRQEDQAYCLIGIFGVSMPLMYGEQRQTFRRLQEGIPAVGGDASLFAWDFDGRGKRGACATASILACFPKKFQACGDVIQRFESRRMLFEMSNRGIILMTYRSFNAVVLQDLLNHGSVYLSDEQSETMWLTVPLSYYRRTDGPSDNSSQVKSIFLCLALDNGKWRRVGTTSQAHPNSWGLYRGKHHPAYANDYVRLHLHDERIQQRSRVDLSDIAERTPANILDSSNPTGSRIEIRG